MHNLIILTLSLVLGHISMAADLLNSEGSAVQQPEQLEVTLNFNSDLQSPAAKTSEELQVEDLETLVAIAILNKNETNSQTLSVHSVRKVSPGVFKANIDQVGDDVTAIRFSVSGCGWSGTMPLDPPNPSYAAVAMLPGCPDTKHSFTTNLKPRECKEATFPKYPGKNARDRNSIESSMKGLLRALGMNGQEVSDMCEKDAQCWLTTDECRLMGISSSPNDGVDHTGGRASGSYKVCRNGDGTFSFTALCECWPRH